MITIETNYPTTVEHDRDTTNWINPVTGWITTLYKAHYQEWLKLAQSLLPKRVKMIDECEDIVHEAIVESLTSLNEGYAFASKDQLEMHIKRAICLIGHVVATEQYWVV